MKREGGETPLFPELTPEQPPELPRGGPTPAALEQAEVPQGPPQKQTRRRSGAGPGAAEAEAPAEAPGDGPRLNAAGPAPERAELLLWLHDRVTEAYGDLPLEPRREPMHELVSTILSQRTTHADEEAAYFELRELGDWDAIAAAPVEAVAHAIRRSNYPDQKAPRIQATLHAICEQRGDYDLDFLKGMEVGEGLKWLTSLPGVGAKTASLVLLFCYAKPVFPVDTHIHRITSRVGVIPKMGEGPAHKALLALLPPDPPLLYELHINTLRHGQRVCTFSHPKCGQCVLRERCDAYAVYGNRVPTFEK